MNAVTKIKEEFQSDHADQLAAIRSDIKRLRTDLVALGDDLIDNKAAKQRRKTRPGSEVWAHRLSTNEPHEMRKRQIAGAAIAGAIVLAAGAFAICSSKRATTA
jgi:hypothetical protein